MEFIPEPKRKQTTQAPKQILWPRKETVDFPRLQTTSAPSDLRRIAMVSYSEYPQDPPHRTQEELVWLKLQSKQNAPSSRARQVRRCNSEPHWFRR